MNALRRHQRSLGAFAFAWCFFRVVVFRLNDFCLKFLASNLFYFLQNELKLDCFFGVADFGCEDGASSVLGYCPFEVDGPCADYF